MWIFGLAQSVPSSVSLLWRATGPRSSLKPAVFLYNKKVTQGIYYNRIFKQEDQCLMLIQSLKIWSAQRVPVSFGLHDIWALASQLLQSLSDNCLLLVFILLNHGVSDENINVTSNICTLPQYYTCGRSCVRCLSLSLCFRPRRSSSAFLFCTIDRRSWTWRTNSVIITTLPLATTWFIFSPPPPALSILYSCSSHP